MATSDTDNLRCPNCRNADRIQKLDSYKEEFFSLPNLAHKALPVAPGAVMLVYLLSSLQFLAGSIYTHLTAWPSAFSAQTNLLPKPLLFAAMGTAILLVATDRATRRFLLHAGRIALLQPQLYQELNAKASPVALVAAPVGLASFGYGLSLGLGSLDLWASMSTAWSSPGPDWVRLTVQSFLIGGLAVLGGLPFMALVMGWTARVFSDSLALPGSERSFGNITRSLAYPYGLGALMMGFALSIGFQVLTVLTVLWFVAATFLAARRTLRLDIEVTLPVALLSAGPVAMAFLFVTLRVRMNVVSSGWDSPGVRPPAMPDLELLWFASAIALAALLALTAYLGAARDRREDAETKRLRRQAVATWRKLIYCERCGGVHLPNQRDFVPASEVARLLPGSGEMSER